MATVTTEQIKQLRDKTGAGMMEVKNALVEAEGDMAKAMELLRQKGAATAEKKASRATAEGKIATQAAGNVAALVEVNCETDFSANNERFLALVAAAAEAALTTETPSVEALLNSSTAQGTLKNTLTETIGVVKENMAVARFVRYQLQGEGQLFSYIHGGGKIGVLLELGADKAASAQAPAFGQLAKDLAMHIAAFAPEFVSKTEIPAEVLAEETRIEMGKEDLASKPEAMREKIVAGRVEKNLATRVLLSQDFVKDPSKKVEAVLASLGQELGDTVVLRRFVRYALGELSLEALAAQKAAEAAEASAMVCGI